MCVSQGDYAEAAVSLHTCLSVLSRVLPSSTFGIICSLSWNLIRYCLRKPAPLGWLVRLFGGRHEGEESQTSSRDAALVYHQLNQLQLTGVFVCVQVYMSWWGLKHEYTQTHGDSLHNKKYSLYIKTILPLESPYKDS